VRRAQPLCALVALQGMTDDLSVLQRTPGKRTRIPSIRFAVNFTSWMNRTRGGSGGQALSESMWTRRTRRARRDLVSADAPSQHLVGIVIVLTRTICSSDASRGSVTIDLERGNVSRNVDRGDGQVCQDGGVRRRSIAIPSYPSEFRCIWCYNRPEVSQLKCNSLLWNRPHRPRWPWNCKANCFSTSPRRTPRMHRRARRKRLQ
jgi:hypothetical protein